MFKSGQIYSPLQTLFIRGDIAITFTHSYWKGVDSLQMRSPSVVYGDTMG
jgi:hypothetical protein